jgi:4-oxalocrotonate tautomerase
MPYVHVTLAAGRPLEAKQALMSAVAEAVHEAIDAPLDTIRVWVTEVDPKQMSIGGVPLDEVRQQRAAGTAV